MQLGDNLGFLGILLALIGLGVTLLWPTKRWIGGVFLIAAIPIGVWWFIKFREKPHLEPTKTEASPETRPTLPVAPVKSAPPSVVSKPESFVYAFPGVTTADNQWLFLLNHHGPKPTMNIAVEFTDDVSRQQHAELDTMTKMLHFDEIDANGRGSIFAHEFLWKPPVFEHESYSIMITSRDRTIDEKLQLERDDEKWYEDIQAVDRETKKVLINCQDKGFPRPRVAPGSCFPDPVKAP